MFSSCITNTALTTTAANRAFSGTIPLLETWREDVSFVSTLRALLGDKVSRENPIFVCYRCEHHSVPTLRSASTTTITRAVSNDHTDRTDGTITIVNLNGYSDANTILIEALEAEFESQHDGWVKLEKVTQFFAKQFRVLCFINPCHRKVIIYAEDLDLAKLHYLQCAIPAYMPWYFYDDGSTTVSEADMNLLQSLRLRSDSQYLALSVEFANKTNINERFVRDALATIESSIYKERLESIEDDIRNKMESVVSLNNRIDRYLSDINELRARVAGIEAMVASASDGELLNLFLRRKDLHLQLVEGSYITFTVTGHIFLYDEDTARKMIENERSVIYERASARIPADDMRLFMTSVFLDQTLKIRVCATYRLNLVGNVRGVSRWEFDPAIFNSHLPNPHVDRYECLSGSEQVINQVMAESGDYMFAIEQCVGSAMNINFSDSVVMEEFMKCLYNSNPYRDIPDKFVELPDGSVVSVIDAIKYIKEVQENGENH